MSKNNKSEMKSSTTGEHLGYQPLNKGYQPREKGGYTPTSGNTGNAPPKPPKGGTGQSSGKS